VLRPHAPSPGKFQVNFANPFKKKNREHPKFTEGKSAFYNGLKLSDNPYGMDTDYFSKWASGWEEAFHARRIIFEVSRSHAIDWNFDWDSVYRIGGYITGVITFIVCWIYAIASWGFLLGVGLGWIPSLFIAVIARFIWPLLALVLIIGLCVVAFLFYKSS